MIVRSVIFRKGSLGWLWERAGVSGTHGIGVLFLFVDQKWVFEKNQIHQDITTILFGEEMPFFFFTGKSESFKLNFYRQFELNISEA